MDPITHPPPHEQIRKLTPRQLEIVALLAEGKTNQQTADILSISRETVKSHIAKACIKCGVENRIQLIVLYVVWKVSQKL